MSDHPYDGRATKARADRSSAWRAGSLERPMPGYWSNLVNGVEFRAVPHREDSSPRA